SSNPTSTSALALDHECAAVERELRLAPHRDFELLSRWAVTVDELMRHLNELEPRVLHFAGHGVPGGRRAARSATKSRDIASAGDNDGSGIYLLDEQGGPQLVTARALTSMIRCAAP